MSLGSAKTYIKPLHVFLTGHASCGKSFLMKVVYQAVTKTLSYKNPTLDTPKVLILGPTGVAAINADGTTIHLAIQIPVGNFGNKLPQLSEKMKSSLSNKLCEVKLIIIDEISMVSNLLLYHIHLRLVEIFGCPTHQPFAGLLLQFAIFIS